MRSPYGPVAVVDLDDWREQAACVGHDPDLWFAPAGRNDLRDKAKGICTGCPVRRLCLQEALQVGYESDCGVWGGTTQKERKELRRNGAA